jgi:trans-2,3-dihydro-3-hydroxyanthranilate isomerase
MNYPFHIVDVFSSTPFGGNQLAVLPDASGISSEGMQKIAREFNFGETALVLPKNDLASTCRVRIFSPRTELDFAGHPAVGTACALVMKQHVRLSDQVRLILEARKTGAVVTSVSVGVPRPTSPAAKSTCRRPGWCHRSSSGAHAQTVGTGTLRAHQMLVSSGDWNHENN